MVFHGEGMKRIAATVVGGGITLLFLFAPAFLYAVEYSLEDLCRIALDRSEKLRAAEENLVIAETSRDKALSYLLPTLTAKAGLKQYSERKIHRNGNRPPAGKGLHLGN